SWLHTLSYIRNVCAHYGRLYGKDLIIKPQLNAGVTKGFFDNGRVFSAVFVLSKFLHQDDYIKLASSLRLIIEEYSDYINLKYIGFPRECETVLLTFCNKDSVLNLPVFFILFILSN